MRGAHFGKDGVPRVGCRHFRFAEMTNLSGGGNIAWIADVGASNVTGLSEAGSILQQVISHRGKE